MDAKREVRGIVDFLKTTLVNSGTRGFALGLSGGIDSAVCAALAARAINELKEENANAPYWLDLIILPMGNVSADAESAQEVAASINVAVRSVNLGPALDSFLFAHGADVDVKAIGNVKARLRMTAIYYSANVNNLLVLGTDNLSETYTGYFTKHGDGAADVFPISGYTKRQVYALGRELGLPEVVLTRAPSAGLWEGQTDEGELGIPYDFIDNRLEGLEEQNVIEYGGLYNGLAGKLTAQHEATEHKRDAPHIYIRQIY